MVNDGFKAKLRLLGNEQFHFLADCERRGGVLNPAINAGRACWSTLIVEINLHHGISAWFQWMLLLSIWDEQVLTESPVGEGAQMVHLGDFQPRDFSDSDFGTRILRVVVASCIVFDSEYLRKRQCIWLLHTTSAINQCLQEVRWVYRVRHLYEFHNRHRLRALSG